MQKKVFTLTLTIFSRRQDRRTLNARYRRIMDRWRGIFELKNDLKIKLRSADWQIWWELNRKLILCIAGSGLLLLGLGISISSQFIITSTTARPVSWKLWKSNYQKMQRKQEAIVQSRVKIIRGRAFSGPQYVQGGVLLHKAVHCHW